MTDQQHPITPPPELVEQWRTKPEFAEPGHTTVVSMTQSRLRYIAAQAARWGAARRLKPPSLKEQALAVIENSAICDHLSPEHAAILRRALEQLDD